MLLLLLVVVPLVGAAVVSVLGDRHRERLGLGACLASAATGCGLVLDVWREGIREWQLTSPVGLEIVLVADGLSAALVGMTAVAGGFVAAFAAAQHRTVPDERHRAYWPLYLLLWAGLHTLFVAGDLFTIYLMLELIGICGAALVVLGGDRRALRAGTRYFFAEFAASATFLLGVALVWAEAGTVTLRDLPEGVATTPLGAAGLAFMTAGLLLKVPLVPLHFWLPGAHWLAPSTVSPILSGVVVKTAFAVLIRLWFVAMPGSPPASAHLLGALGAAAVLWGSLNALRVGPVKLLVAHSTVAQLGFMFLLVPLARDGATTAWNGGIIQAVAHAPAKAAALMAVAVLVRDSPGDTVSDMAGAAARRPLSVFAFGVASLSLVGLPPSGGFLAKWYLLLGSFDTGQWWWAVVIVVGSLLTAAYLMRVIKQSFAPAPAGWEPVVSRDRREVIALGLALAALAMGLRPSELLDLLQVGAPVLGAMS